jgi:hypothetical protein
LIGVRLLVLAAAVVSAACDQPPVKEIEAAEQQVARAAAAEADRYAAERFRQAQAALAAARQRLEERDYRGALSSANEAADSARQAMAATGPAKAAARESAEVALAEVKAALDRAASERAAAVKAGVPRPRLAALDARAVTARAALAGATRQLQAGEIEAARTAADALRTDVASLPDHYREVRTRHSRRPRAGAGRSPRRR